MRWKNIDPEIELTIPNHDYKKLSEEEKKNWIKEEDDVSSPSGPGLLDVLGGGLLGEDSDD